MIENVLDPIIPKLQGKNTVPNKGFVSSKANFVSPSKGKHCCGGQHHPRHVHLTGNAGPQQPIQSAYVTGGQYATCMETPRLDRSQRHRNRPEFISAMGALRQDMKLWAPNRISLLLKFMKIHINHNRNLRVEQMLCFCALMSDCSNDVRVRMLQHFRTGPSLLTALKLNSCRRSGLQGS